MPMNMADYSDQIAGDTEDGTVHLLGLVDFQFFANKRLLLKALVMSVFQLPHW